RAAPWRGLFASAPGLLRDGKRLPRPEPPAGGDRYTLPTPLHVPRYYGVPIDRPSSHVVFCLDVSQSMYGRGIEQARDELERTLLEFPSTYRFDVIAFNERLHPFAGELVPAHPVMKQRVLAWLDRLETISYTNLYDAVEMAFGYAGLGPRPADRPTRLDAIFLLSDGAPNRGRYLREARVVRGIAELSRRRIPVHCVAAGEEVFPLLEANAAATGGRFVDAFEWD
ncbi:MAG: VWA domain-containing protein, partial [Planctomycetota bacterium]